MIHHDYMFKGFKVRTYRQTVWHSPSGTDDAWFRTMVWNGNLVHRGEAMPEKPDAEEDALNWIEFILSV